MSLVRISSKMLYNKEDSKPPFFCSNFNGNDLSLEKVFVVIFGNYGVSVLIRAQGKWYSKDTPKYNGLDERAAHFSLT